MRITIFAFVSIVLVIQAYAQSPAYRDFIGTNGILITNYGTWPNRKLHVDGRHLQPASANLTNWANLPTNVVSGAGGTGEVSTVQLLNASNVLRSAFGSADSSTLSSAINYTLTTSNSIVGGLAGGSGGGGVALAPTNIPSATAFTVNANWQVSCVSLAHNTTVVVSNLSLGQVDARLIVTNSGAFTMTFPQFGAGNWEDGVIPALPANRTATIIFSRPTALVTNVLMRGQDLLLAVAGPSAIGTNATTATITNLIGFYTNNTFGVPTLAGYINELNFIGATGSISGTRFTGSVPGTGGGGGGATSVESNITVSATNNFIIDFEAANIFRVFIETNFTYTVSNMPSLANWPSHIADIYFKMGTNGGYLLNNYYVDNGHFVTNQNMQPTTNANAVDLMQIKYGWFTTNAAAIWVRDLQPRTVVQAFGYSNNMTLWWVADDLTGLPDNTQVGTVTNRMAGQLSFTNALAGVIKSNSVVNGHASLFFNGTGFLQAVQQTNWAHFVGAESATMFFVMRQRSTDHQNCLFQWISAGEQIDLFATYDDVFYWEIPNNGPSGSINGAQPVTWDDMFHILEVVRGNDTATILVDGVVVASGTPTANFTTGDNGIYWTIGGTAGGGTAFTGDMAEMRWFNDAKSATDRALIRAQLKATYNTP